MPIYDIKCKTCGNEEEVRVVSYKGELPKCSKCQNETEKMFKPTNLIAYYKRKDAYYGD